MRQNDFRTILTSAIAGDHDALEVILCMYAPLINRNSIVDGQLDEDLRQYILIHIAQTISKFPI